MNTIKDQFLERDYSYVEYISSDTLNWISKKGCGGAGVEI